MAYKEKKDAVAYNNKFNKEAYDRINLTVPKGQKEVIQQAAQQNGESVNGFIWRLIQAELEKVGADSFGISEPRTKDSWRSRFFSHAAKKITTLQISKAALVIVYKWIDERLLCCNGTPKNMTKIIDCR